MNVLAYGPGAWLVELPDGDPLGYAAALARRQHPDVAELVPAARTVLVRVRVGASAADLAPWLAAVEPDVVASGDPPPGEVVEIPVSYDGEDLDHVAAATGLGVDEVVARHAGGRYRCAFCGFAPGFAYLRGLDPALELPRRSTPRTRVPAGAVAIADSYAAVYPSASPGGWHLIGRTAVTLWDPGRDPPALVRPGTAVRFVVAP